MFNDNNKGEIHLGLGQFARVLPGQVRIYARKSYGRGDGSNRSIADQIACGVELCQQFGIPVDSSVDARAEPVGYSGGTYWEGGGRTNIEGDSPKEKKPRPVLTKLCREIASGQVKVLVVWSLDRLARSVALMGTFIELLNRHGVFLMDRNGLVPIHTPEGRQMVNTNMATAQHYREMCKVNCERALRRMRERGELATTPNSLGFRSDGNGGVAAIADDLAMVNRMFRMFDAGENGSGPMNAQQIADTLNAEGFKWSPDRGKMGGEARRAMDTKVSGTMVREALQNLRYQAKQEHEGVIYDAKELLIDGQPAVDPALFQRVARRIGRNRHTARRAVNGYPLSGLVRCGVCSRRFSARPNRWSTKDGGSHVNNVWRFKKNGSFFNCTHDLVGLQLDILDDYVRHSLGPLLLAELQQQQRVLKGSATASRIAELRLRLEELRTKQTVELPRLMRGAWEKNPKLVADMHEIIESDINSVENEIVRLQLQESVLADELSRLTNLAQVNEAEFRETARSVIRWAAIVPEDLDAPRGRKRRGYSKRLLQGKVLFCTAWGTYHTAVIEWGGKSARSKQPFNTLRDAAPHEVLGGIEDLPEPSLFFENLRREFVGRSQAFDPTAWCPGYRADDITIEEFIAEYSLLPA